MEKYFNDISIAGGTATGFLVFILGGWDTMLKALITMVVLDYLTGLIKAIINKEMSSEVGGKGIMKKVLIFVIIAATKVAQDLIGDVMPIREIVIMFYVTNEGLSLLENAAEFLPVPEQLKAILIQLRESKESEEEEYE